MTDKQRDADLALIEEAMEHHSGSEWNGEKNCYLCNNLVGDGPSKWPCIVHRLAILARQALGLQRIADALDAAELDEPMMVALLDLSEALYERESFHAWEAADERNRNPEIAAKTKAQLETATLAHRLHRIRLNNAIAARAPRNPKGGE